MPDDYLGQLLQLANVYNAFSAPQQAEAQARHDMAIKLLGLDQNQRQFDAGNALDHEKLAQALQLAGYERADKAAQFADSQALAREELAQRVGASQQANDLGWFTATHSPGMPVTSGDLPFVPADRAPLVQHSIDSSAIAPIIASLGASPETWNKDPHSRDIVLNQLTPEQKNQVWDVIKQRFGDRAFGQPPTAPQQPSVSPTPTTKPHDIYGDPEQQKKVKQLLQSLGSSIGEGFSFMSHSG